MKKTVEGIEYKYIEYKYIKYIELLYIGRRLVLVIKIIGRLTTGTYSLPLGDFARRVMLVSISSSVASATPLMYRRSRLP